MIMDEIMVNRRLVSVMAWDLCTALTSSLVSSAVMDVPLLLWGHCAEWCEPTGCSVLFSLRKMYGLQANIRKNIYIHSDLKTPRYKEKLRNNTVSLRFLLKGLVIKRGKLIRNLKLVSKRHEKFKPHILQKNTFNIELVYN